MVIVRESPQNTINSDLGVIVICPDIWGFSPIVNTRIFKQNRAVLALSDKKQEQKQERNTTQQPYHS